jgi:hypothetical protein
MIPREALDPPYIVFIDQMGPLHPDVLLLDLTFGVSMEIYSAMVCRGLAHIERQLGLQAVIAAHPRATPGILEPWYEGRTIVYGESIRLIANAEVVVAEASTSLGIAVLCRRPIVLMSAAVFFPESQMYTHAFARALSTDVLDLDASELPPLSLDVDENAYHRYVEQFVKRPDTADVPFWSVVASEILSDADQTGECD